MDINKLTSFLTVANLLNYSKAAKQLYITQPALSKRIQALEAELDTPLFDYVCGQTSLTIQGEYFKSIAEKIVGEYAHACEYLHQIANLEHGELHFGTTHLIGVYLMPELLAQFHQIYPGITVNMEIDSSSVIIDMLRKNQLEFVMVSDYILDCPDMYECHPYYTDELELVVGQAHPLFGKTSCTIKQIKDDLYITKGPQSSQYRFLEKHGIFFSNQYFISNQEAIKECVIRNIGISIMSTKMVEREIKAGLLSALHIDDLQLKRDIDFVVLSGHSPTPAASEFEKLVNTRSRK